jgi:hypothetical protein
MNKKSDLRKCPECGEMTGHIMHIDEFPCKCGDVVTVEYAVCDCGMSWRAADGTFVDGCNMSIENVEELLSEVENFFEDQEVFAGENSVDSMEDLIHKCLKCGAVATHPRPDLYECTACGFSWEVDKFNE